MKNNFFDLKQFFQESKKHTKALFNKKTFIKEIPNLLTASRLLSPIIILPLTIMGHPFIAGIAIIIFGITDLLDGFTARLLNTMSLYGSKLDAAVDKVFAVSTIIPAIVYNPSMFIILGGEILIGSIILHSNKKGNLIRSNIFGKTKTWFLFACIAASFIGTKHDAIKQLNYDLTLITLILQGVTASFYIAEHIGKEKTKKIVSQISKLKDISEEDLDKLDKTAILDIKGLELVNKGINKKEEQKLVKVVSKRRG